jgi:hypothetical protein
MTLAAKAARSEERTGRSIFTAADNSSLASRFPSQRDGKYVIPTDDARLSYVDPAFVEKLAGRLRAQTPECVMDTFGISVNTWVKMRKGLPIRKSVAERLVQRIGVDLQ